MGPGWRLTWEDSEDDYVYLDASGRQAGRVYLSPQKVWRWFFAGQTGRSDSRREALLTVEMECERAGLVQPPPQPDRDQRHGNPNSEA
jgi:hypothetical protein